jgi:hypothetical protein
MMQKTIMISKETSEKLNEVKEKIGIPASKQIEKGLQQYWKDLNKKFLLW